MLVFLFLSACCFYQIKPVHAITTYLSDTFESFSTGWTVAGNPANPLKSGEQKHGDSFSAVVNCTLVANYAYGYKAVSSTPKSDYRISLWVYPSSTVNAISIQLGGGYNTTTSTYNFKFALNCSGGQFYLQNSVTDGAPGTWENVETMTNNTWHQIEAYFVKSTTKIRYYIDNVKQGGDWNSLNNVFPERFYFGDTSASVFMGKFWIDDLVIDDTAEVVPDTTAPTYTTIAHNTSAISSPCLFSCLWADNVGLSGFIFGTNNTGVFANETWSALEGVSAWANVTKTLNSTPATTILFQWWANDSSNNWNNTGSQTFVLQCGLTLYWIDATTPSYISVNSTSYGSASNTTVVYTNANDTVVLLFYSASSTSYPNLFIVFTDNGNQQFNNPYTFPMNNSNHIIWFICKSGTSIIPSFTVAPKTAYINETVTFDCSATWTAYYPIVSSYWDFGDGTFNNTLGTTTTHSYSAAGNYTVTVYPDDGYIGFGPGTSRVIVVTEDTSWYIAPGFILGLICFMGVGLVFVKKRHS